MVEIGYALSSEEHAPNDLARHARQAEVARFSFALISDHYHPWVDRQGQGPFVWSVIGGIAQVTQRLRLGTGVTCPIIRIHRAIIAQAAATVWGPDPEPHWAKIKTFADAGFDHLYVHQVGPDQEGFLRLYEREVLPKVST